MADQSTPPGIWRRLERADPNDLQQALRLIEELGQAVKRLQHRHHRAMETRLAGIGSSLAQWDALRAVSRRPDSSTRDLAAATFQTEQSFGALANRLSERGLVDRIPGPGRAVRHRLTADGEALLERGYAAVREVQALAFSPLSADEAEQFGALLARLLDGPDLSA